MASNFEGLSAIFFNGTLKKSPEISNTEGLLKSSMQLMEKLGDNSSQTKLLIERLYSNSGELNEKGQWAYYGKVGGCMITGNEDGVKHCAMNVLYSLQHIGYTIPPQADAGWIGAIGPGPSYLDEGSGGPESDFTNRNVTFMTYNLLHTAKRLKKVGGLPAEGNLPKEWEGGEHFGYSNPEYR